MPLKLRDKYTFDQLSLGEIMLRLDPGEGRIRTAREFKVWEGGGEYNVARGLRKCFGLKTAVCTAFVDNEVGHLIEDFIMQGGVATDYILWRADDGIGARCATGSILPSAASASVGRSACLTVVTRRPASSSPVISTGRRYSVKSACAGSIRAASSPH